VLQAQENPHFLDHFFLCLFPGPWKYFSKTNLWDNTSNKKYSRILTWNFVRQIKLLCIKMRIP
jgi:hypothetical protein